MSPNEPRQRVERVAGSRRAKLTPAPGAVPEADVIEDPADDDAASASSSGGGPNDERMRREVPPHY